MGSVGKVMRRPGIIILGVLIFALAGAFVSLGFWQLDRLDERRDFNRTLTARTDLPVVDLAELIPDPQRPPAEAAYRRVSVTGTYLVEEEVVIVGRSRNTLAGNHVATPLLVEGTGAAVVVNRGWVPLEDSKPPVAKAAPPAGTVTVTGVLFPSQQRGRFGPRHTPEGRLDQLHRLDLARLDTQIDTPLHDFYLLLETQDPPQTGTYPQDVDLPRLDEGPHLSYSLQWFAFALTALVVYAAFVTQAIRRASR